MAAPALSAAAGTLPRGSARAIVKARPIRRHGAPGNGCGRRPDAGEAETEARHKHVSGAADRGASREGGPRQFLFRTPCTINSGGRGCCDVHSRADAGEARVQEGEKAGTLSVLTNHVIVPRRKSRQRTRVATARSSSGCAAKGEMGSISLAAVRRR